MEIGDIEKKYKNFYAPVFQIKVDGTDIVKDKNVEVESVSVDSKIDGADRFSFSVINVFDAESGKLNWMDDLLLAGGEVEIYMGYLDVLVQVMGGVITEVTTSFPSGGVPKLSVSGYDATFKMRKNNEPRDKKKSKDSDFAKEIASEYGLSTSNVETTVEKYEVIKKTDKENDYKFLDGLAKRNGFEFFVKNKDMYFGKSKLDKKEVASLTWGESLISFTPTINVSGQVSKVEVRGWDFKNKKEIVGKASSSDIEGRSDGEDSGTKTSEAAGSEPVHREHLPVSTQAEADERAKTIINKLAEGYVEGSGEMIGIPDIWPGENIKLDRLAQFSKTYYLKAAKHSIGSSGYKTTFNVKEKFL